MTLLDYLDSILIIHLPTRTDRFEALRSELARIGVSIDGPKVRIPEAPMPRDANGLPSRGVYGSFLSHLQNLEIAEAEKHVVSLTLEDDAIFSRRFNNIQNKIVSELQQRRWDLFFLGHSLNLAATGTVFVESNAPFMWAHCYGIHSRVRRRLIEYLRLTLNRPAGHPQGGKMYIDGALNLFRQFNPDIVTLVAAPALSVQKGSPSSIANSRWYDRSNFTRPIVTWARGVRDEAWRRGWL
jgi:GR25 family glycosyltransferase involved in LPS biosynthesis